MPVVRLTGHFETPQDHNTLTQVIQDEFDSCDRCIANACHDKNQLLTIKTKRLFAAAITEHKAWDVVVWLDDEEWLTFDDDYLLPHAGIIRGVDTDILVEGQPVYLSDTASLEHIDV